MRKIAYTAIGVIIGAVLSLSGQALADSLSKVGKKVQNEYTVVVNGKELPVKAISIDGTSYTPNRAFAEATNSDIDFKNNTVILNTNTGDVMEEVVTSPEPTASEPVEEPTNVDVGNFTLKSIDPTIQGIESLIEVRKRQMKLAPPTNPEEQAEWDKVFADLNAKLERYKAIKAELERLEAQQ